MKKLFPLLFFVLMTASSVAQAGFLDQNTVGDITNNTGAVQTRAGYDPNTTVGSVVGTVIKAFLGLLGVIFIVLIVIAGFNWMTAAGDEEKIQKATKTIRSAIIGLIIIVAAYAITYFVFKNLPGAGTSSSNGGGSGNWP